MYVHVHVFMDVYECIDVHLHVCMCVEDRGQPGNHFLAVVNVGFPFRPRLSP